jgi:hypothetical protein
MKKQHHCLLVGILLLYFTNLQAQNQQVSWPVFVPNNSTRSITFNFGTPSTGYFLGIARDESNSPLTTYKGINSAFDDQGNFIFGVITTNDKAFVYDNQMNLVRFYDFANGELGLGGIKATGSKEIPMVKIGCGLVYHFIVGHKILEYNTITKEVKNAAYETPQTVGSPTEFGAIGGVNIFDGGASRTQTVAAIRPINENQYAIYWLDGNRPGQAANQIRAIYHRVINTKPSIAIEAEINTSFTSLSPSSVYHPVLFTGGYVAPLEVSPDGKFLAFAENDKLFVFNINTNGSVGSLKTSFTYGSGVSNINYKVAGIEFNATSDRLVFSRFNTNGSLSDAIGVVNLTNNQVTYIANTNDYSRSEIELGRDNKLYTTTPSGLFEINPNTQQIQLAHSVAFASNNEYTDADNNYQIRTLPDQNDGVNNAGGFNAQVDALIINNTQTWANGFTNNPYGVNNAPINVKQNITINGNLTINGLTLQFFSDAKIVIKNGGVLTLNGTTLKAFDCGYLWDGIVVENGGRLTVNPNFNPTTPNATVASTIRDAKVAISTFGAGGPAATIQVRQTNFRQNAECIKLSYYEGQNITVSHNTFNMAEALIPQNPTATVGQLVGINVPNEGRYYPFRGVYALVNNNSSTLNITNNTFRGGKEGVNTYAANCNISNNTFEQMRKFNGTAIIASKFNSNTLALTANNNTIQYVNKAITITRGYDITLDKNQVYFTTDNAIEITNNRSRIMSITENNLSLCANNAVLLNACSGSGSRLTIRLNTIIGNGLNSSNGNGSVYTYNGITLQEQAFSTLKTYAFCDVSQNQISRVWYGIKLNNIVGDQVNDYVPTGATWFNANRIAYNAAASNQFNLNPHTNCGVEVVRSAGVSVFDNGITSNLPSSALNNGVYSNISNTTLVNGNTIQAGRGLHAAGTSLNNNYLCNTFNNNVNGIYLLNHYLRNRNGIHGENNITRDNTHNNTSSARPGILLEASPRSTTTMRNMIRQNQWLFYTSPPIIRYNPAPSGFTFPRTIVNSTIPLIDKENPCGFILSPPQSPSDPSFTSIDDVQELDAVTQWETRYQHERELHIAGNTSNGWLSQLITAEKTIVAGDFGAAQQMLGGLTATNAIEHHLLTVYGVAVNIGLREEEFSTVTEEEKAILLPIAEMNPLEIGPAVFVARGLLLQHFGLLFNNQGSEDDAIAQVQVLYKECFEEDNMPFTPENIYLINSNYQILPDVTVGFDEYGYAFVNNYDLETLIEQDEPIAFAITLNNQEVFTSNFYTPTVWLGHSGETINLCNMGKKAITLTKAEAKKTANINVYPNPSEGLLQVTGVGQGSVKLYDITGKLVKNTTFTDSLIELNDLGNGMYYLHIFSSEGNLLLKTKHFIDK